MGIDRGAGLEETPEEAVYCSRHPDVETYLRCGKCDTPICPRCLVQTPVGARCRECANLSRIPTFNVTPEYFARGMMAALASGAATGAAWAFLFGGARLGFLFAILVGLAIGWAVSEAIGRATNYKRGLGLQVCAILGVTLAYLVQETLAPGDVFFGRRILDQGEIIAGLVAAAFAFSKLKGF